MLMIKQSHVCHQILPIPPPTPRWMIYRMNCVLDVCLCVQQGQPNQWTLAFEGLEKANFLNGHVQWVYGHHGRSGFVQMENHFFPIHHLPFNLAVQYPIFLGILLLSQGCDHVGKALGLNHKACNCCVREGASLLALCLFALAFIFSRCKNLFFNWSLCTQVANVLFFTMALCFQAITIFFFALVHLF
jgi:hypothetical protein